MSLDSKFKIQNFSPAARDLASPSSPSARFIASLFNLRTPDFGFRSRFSGFPLSVRQTLFVKIQVSGIDRSRFKIAIIANNCMSDTRLIRERELSEKYDK